MGVIERKDLKYEYSDVAANGDDPKETGKRDRDRLNRQESYEVVDFINSFCKKYGLTTKEEALEVERLLQEESDLVKKEVITNWLEEKLKLSKSE
ncbi:conserved hypothetical protein [Tenacibaculum maritimum]|uniref:hypothetical protein n=1 Tax=Tenacibaculum maritimum TaxID=107401 RepID=UPI0012E4BC5A|nr:hypothetical protein [Tenacibaculum maritimum]CAA0147988.1 conserved hypothetical protein [Tenacibaculum maritimum]CAA0148014.1 conserved hypothetical protein [Tenacibaculum maritimum]CAA0168546.1 conserved hypothetical protein [Tenacibaculum maritimum]CAA0193858.1 conserved hypothetical protein [Tenacibaculum maritimum]CAA0201179.1 conserved hypothetical protein [Tenacibaculum maritimum]